ncbi:hypothetical protein Tco_0132760 [Tanacetum coccineum]
MIEGNGPKWLFDIESLTQSMNYVPVAVGTIINESAGTQGEHNAGISEEISQDYIVMPIWKDASYFDSPSKDVDIGEPKSAADDQKQVKDGLDNENDEKDKSDDDSSPKEVNAAGQHVTTASPTLKATHVEFFSDEYEPEVDLGNITNSYKVPPTPNTRIHKDHPIENVIGDVKSSVQTRYPELLGLKDFKMILRVTTTQCCCGIRAFALRNFDLEVMEFKSAHSNTTAKLPILKLGEYEMWVIRIKQYFQVLTADDMAKVTGSDKHGSIGGSSEYEGKPQQDDTGFVDSGFSRHMNRNIVYLLDFKEFDGGYVTFGRGAHGGRISGQLIEVARTMLADSKLPTIFWAEAVSMLDRYQGEKLMQDVDNSEPKSVVDNQKQVEYGLDNKNDEKDKSDDDSSPKKVNVVGQHVNTASPDVNTGSFKLML